MEAAIANIYLAVFAFMYFNVQGIYVVSKAKDAAVVLCCFRRTCKKRPHVKRHLIWLCFIRRSRRAFGNTAEAIPVPTRVSLLNRTVIVEQSE